MSETGGQNILQLFLEAGPAAKAVLGADLKLAFEQAPAVAVKLRIRIMPEKAFMGVPHGPV